MHDVSVIVLPAHAGTVTGWSGHCSTCGELTGLWSSQGGASWDAIGHVSAHHRGASTPPGC